MRTSTPRGRGSAGFTLLELMVVLAVAAVLSSVAAPSLLTFIHNQRLRSLSFDLVSDLLLARSEALTRQTAVVITPLTTNTDGWSAGWSINLGTAGGTLVTSRSGVAASLRFDAKNSSAASVSSLTVGADGRMTGATPMRIEVKFTSPEPDGVSPSCITIDATGRPRSSKGAC